jgi:UDP-N-acetylglucosamine transferase subunit ALG13
MCVRQVGRGNAAPEDLPQVFKDAGISCSCFRFCDSLEPFLNEATLVISHAGAGSIIESLNTPSRPYLIVSVSIAASAISDDLK